MFIVWGKRAKYRRVGYVADFCPMCCRERPFVLERVGMAGHVYYISFGSGELVGYQRVCCKCNNVFNAVAEQYRDFAKEPMPLAALVKQTFPDLAEVRKERLLMESHIRSAPLALPADVRTQLIMQPFELLRHKLDWFKQNSAFRSEKKFIRENIIPEIGRTIARLRPTRQELSAALSRLQQLQDDIGSKVKLEDLMADLNGRANGTVAAGSGAKAGAYGARSLDANETSAKMFRWTGVLGGCGAAMAMLVLISGFFRDGVAPSMAAVGLTVLSALAAAACFFLADAIIKRKAWARITGIAAGVALMFAVPPLGTILGAYLVWQLAKGWAPASTAAQFA